MIYVHDYKYAYNQNELANIETCYTFLGGIWCDHGDESLSQLFYYDMHIDGMMVKCSHQSSSLVSSTMSFFL